MAIMWMLCVGIRPAGCSVLVRTLVTTRRETIHLISKHQDFMASKPTAKLSASFILTSMFLVIASSLSVWASEGWVTIDDLVLEPIDIGEPIRVEVQPSEVHLNARRTVMRPVVTGHYQDEVLQDLTRVSEYVSSDEAVARVEDRRILPVGNGTAELSVTVAGHTVIIPVNVKGFMTQDPYSFRYDTLPSLTRNGCNSGACHGSPSGKGGFSLSLLAYDAEFDRRSLIRESHGRRTNVVDPAESLLLLKPTMQVSHGGGLRLRTTDPAYEILRGWIEQGRRGDVDDAIQCIELEVLPSHKRILKRPAHTQQLTALAHFSDGMIRDVTDLAKFSSSDDVVASVTIDGLVVGHDRGQAAILVRYLEKVETVTFTFTKDIEGFVWNDPPENNYIDQLVNQKLRQSQYVPSDLCSDEEFIRRLYLDTIGVLPAIEEVNAFLESTADDRRSHLIDEVLERPEYAKFWAFRWADLLRLNKDNITIAGMHKYYGWLVRQFENNRPFDQFCQTLLTAEGSTFYRPEANYYRATVGAKVRAEATAQLFMGVRIQCASCHNHPFGRWTQDDYYGIVAFFNRINQKESARTGEVVVWTKRDGEVSHPRTGRQVKPQLPRTGDVDEHDGRDRRMIFSEWLTSADNPFFAKVAVNRIWAHVMGRGIVEPVDDFRDSNPPSNSELLDRLAEDFCTSGFDQKQILRTILNSHTYQRSNHTNPLNKDDEKLFSHARVRPLAAEQLLDAICHVTDLPEQFPGLPSGTRATQLPGPVAEHEFLKVFGQPERQTACACERSSDSNLSQALQLFNGTLIHNKLRSEHNRFRKMLDEGKSGPEIISQLYLAALCRLPNEEEVAKATEHIAKTDDRVAAWEDVCWALLNTNEFLFQH